MDATVVVLAFLCLGLAFYIFILLRDLRSLSEALDTSTLLMIDLNKLNKSLREELNAYREQLD